MQHGMSGTTTYSCWTNMIARCTNSNNPNYKHYGSRGISVCESWRNSFETFYKDMGEQPTGLSLDRINNDKGYSKENCRWATKFEQANNGQVQAKLGYSLVGIASYANLKPTTIIARLSRGSSLEEALTTASGALKNRASKNSKSGTRGVSWDAKYKSWKVVLQHNKKVHHLGRFKGKPEALKVLNDKRVELGLKEINLTGE